MKLKLPNSRIMLLFRTLRGINMQASPVFNYTVILNTRTLEPVVTSIQETLSKVPDDLREFIQARESAAMEFAQRDDKHRVVQGVSGIMLADRTGFEQVMNKLRILHPEAHKKLQEYEAGLAAFMAGETEVDLRTLTLAQIPDGLDTRTLDGLFDLIVEEKIVGAPPKPA